VKIIRRSAFPLALMASAGLGIGACSSNDDASSSSKVQFTVSGEVLAYDGYSFPGGDPEFVDGWELHFDRVLTTVDKITLSENPDKVPTDQSQTDGVVAELDGPWAVDLHKQGPLQGKGGGNETALPLGELTNQNKNGGANFDATKRYAFGFDVVPASASAQQVNLDSADVADYQDMITKGYTTLVVGIATFKGGTACTSSDPSYDFTQLPKTVKFRFGFTIPTNYTNCQNPDLKGDGFAGEEHPRGVTILENQPTVAQLTLHTDHIFWDSVEHDSPLHFDHIAAHFVGLLSPGGVPTAELSDLAGVSVNSVTDGKNAPLPWRSCVPADTYTLPSGHVTFDTKGIPTSGDENTAIQDVSEFIRYNTSTMGHLNSDGLCAVKRQYPSPP